MEQSWKKLDFNEAELWISPLQSIMIQRTPIEGKKKKNYEKKSSVIHDQLTFTPIPLLDQHSPS